MYYNSTRIKPIIDLIGIILTSESDCSVDLRSIEKKSSKINSLK